ncbi:Glucose/Sorbosone dehydrogenase [Cynara cardunculus var. scolymus]|uniref:Glucose/Sorbosone dehydrogenase n=1 Tax=Cynara cardunculus var. scolymus TaxID=59895 RepID=A0A118JMH1_CYNCS|nr:Glucose/Sorbosone dehydrogenase [Cynara cardunculus var. scolymus]
MAVLHFIIIVFSLTFLQFLLFNPALSLPLCTDSRAPIKPKTPLAFCPYNHSSCCDSIQDSNIQKQFESMNVSQPGCASVLKSILCSLCDPFSAELFTIMEGRRQVPVLCNSTVGSDSSQTSQATNNFCETVWDSCQNVSIKNSPFSPLLQGQAPPPANATSKLIDIWPSRTDFCTIAGGSSTDGSVCFTGEKVNFNGTTNNTNTSPKGMCLERIGNETFIDMVPHNDGSNRAFFANQKGQIWLATIPEIGSGALLNINESNPYLDLTDEVHFDTATGLMSIAIHPNFTQNGRFFASFNCDKSEWPGCAGRCACNSDVNCDPSKLEHENGAQPCQYQTILFGPDDGYLYFMMGDGGGTADPQNFAQNKKSLLGKIMRFDIDNIPSETEITRRALWGNYSIPRDNPYSEDVDLLPEIWASGLRNPWRCSFDSERSSYFMCGDIGQNEYEEVNLITKDGNYGWRVYEGTDPFVPQESPGGNTSANSIDPIYPVMGYRHSDVNKNEGSASITGGYFYRSQTDPCMYGSYLYADLFATAMWAGTETPMNSGNFTSSKIPFTCASDSPIPCSIVPGSSLPTLGYIFSFAQDNNKDMFLLSSSGVYRIVAPSRCNYVCAIGKTKTDPTQSPTFAPSSTKMLKGSCKNTMFFLVSTLVLLFMASTLSM